MISENRSSLRFRLKSEKAERTETLSRRVPPYNLALAYLRQSFRTVDTRALRPVVLGKNLLAVEILDTARESTRTHQRISLRPAGSLAGNLPASDFLINFQISPLTSSRQDYSAIPLSSAGG